MLQKFFSKYSGWLRSWKFVYVINNYLNSKQLQHNKPLYKKYNLNRNIHSTLGSKDFKNKSKDYTRVDLPNAIELLHSHPDFSSFSKEIQGQILNFVQDGYMILRGFYDKTTVDNVNQEIDRLLNKKEVDFNYTGRKLMDAYKDSAIIKQQLTNDRILNLLNFVMGKTVLPFQTINFIEGSEQRAHSDSIHMTTEPQGHLIATWTALETCTEDNGLLFYYPKSHRLPYVTCEHYDSGNTAWRIGEDSYKQYEDKIETVLNENDFERQHFHASAGDVLIWHANLIHGGSPIKKKGTTRRSMVCHYYCEEVICFHEITQRPAFIEKP